MPRNSQGLYTLPPGNPVVPNTLIESTWANTTMDDISAALTASLPRDGSAPMTGPLTLSADPITGTRQATTKAYVDSFLAYATGMPIGGVMAYAGINIPAGFFECNGQAVSRTTYADLFAAIGTTYGSGDNVSTFNLPDMRDWFIRGKSDSRALGNKQAASFASHVHGVSDPGHGHTLSDPGHAHGASQPAHAHGVNDPGHVHGAGFQIAGIGVNAATAGTPWQANTDAALTGISIQSAQPGVTVNAAVTGASAASNTTGLSIGAAGGTETVPQNIAQIYIIKAVQDSSGPTTLTGIDTSDAQMISVDNTNPTVPELVIHSNTPFGTVKLDASGKVPLAQMATTTSEFMGYFDASSGNLPGGVFSSGSYYAISVGGTLNVYDPVTLIASPTVVAVGGQIHYVSGSVTNPTGWYYVTVAGATLASDVQYIPGGTISGTNVQLAISELDNETQTALAGKAPYSAATGAGTSFPPSGGISASNVTAAIQELDTEKASLTGATFTGNVTVPSLNGGQLAGLRNVLINGNLAINQRGVTIAAAANGSYGPDRWKKVDASNMTQIVEAGNFKPSTQYTLSGTNVITQQITSPGSGNWTLPNIPITATNVQLEQGPIATPFEQRPIGLELMLCQRYYETQHLRTYCPYAPGGVSDILFGAWSVEKRVSPTLTLADQKQIDTIATTVYTPKASFIMGRSAGGNIGAVAATAIADAEL